MIVDCALFSAEAEMLELRFRTLAPVVDIFVVVACSTTHQGQKADADLIQCAFDQALNRTEVPALLMWAHPELSIKVNQDVRQRPPDERGPVGSPFFQTVEREHRDFCAEAARRVASPDAIVMVSDVDEIPKPEAVTRCAELLAVQPMTICLGMTFLSGALNVKHPQQPWWGTTVSRLADCRPQAQRDARTTIGTPEQSVTVLPDSGAHMSWFGTDEDRQRKLDTFSHAELRGRYDPAEGRRAGLHSNGEQLVPISLEQSYALWYPKPLLDGSMEIPECWLSSDAWQAS